ncbi:MAG: exosortase-associated EpsI family protein [Planctomycetota bacterium]|jgi:hypothetical protein
MRRFLPALTIVLVAGLTLVSGLIHGRMSNRWGPSPDTLAVAKKLQDIPDQIGRWQLKAPDKMGDDTVKMLQCAGHILRTYEHQDTGESVNMFVILGPPGPISVHTPEVCYDSRGHPIRDARRRVIIQNGDGPENEFWAVTFRSNDPTADTLRVYYAWSTGDRWSATEGPRYAYAGHPYLYKIQLASRLPSHVDSEVDDPCSRFLQDFVPAAKRYLVAPFNK